MNNASVKPVHRNLVRSLCPRLNLFCKRLGLKSLKGPYGYASQHWSMHSSLLVSVERIIPRSASPICRFPKISERFAAMKPSCYDPRKERTAQDRGCMNKSFDKYHAQNKNIENKKKVMFKLALIYFLEKENLTLPGIEPERTSP